MRVLVLSHMYPRPDDPGFGEFIHRQTRALVQAGHQVTVIAPMMYAPWPVWFHRRWRSFASVPIEGCHDGVHVYRPRFLSPPGMRWHFVEGHTIRQGVAHLVARLHAHTPFDILHANRLFPEAYAALPIAARLNIPLVGMARGMDLNLIPAWGAIYRAQLRQAISGCDGILSVSRALLDSAWHLGPIWVPSGVVYNGVDLAAQPAWEAPKAQLRAMLGLPCDAILATYVGRLEPDKGTPELIRAMAACMRRAPRLHWVAVGRLSQLHYRRDIANTGFAHRIHLLGHLQHERVVRVLQASDFFVFPSRIEGVPNAVLEAMAAGLALVATCAGGTAEVVPPQAGRLVAIGDVKALQDAILELAFDPEKRQQMGMAGRNHVAERLTWAQNALGLTTFYARVLQHKRVSNASRWPRLNEQESRAQRNGQHSPIMEAG